MLRSAAKRRTDSLAQAAETYLSDTFGLAWQLEPLHEPGLPFFLEDGYAFWRADLLGKPVILMAPHEERVSIDELDKHVQAVRSRLGTPSVILLFETLSPTRRTGLIGRRLAFMTPKSQLYVPDALLDLRERTPRAVPREVERFSPTAQMVILGELLEKTRGFTTVGGLAHRYGVADMSMTRAFDELEAGQVAEAPREGRQRMLLFNLKGRALWDAVAGRLQSPVRKVRTMVVPWPDHTSARMAGETALAHYTGLARPKLQRLAVASAEWNTMVRALDLKETESGNPEASEFETWAYDPGALSTDMIVDPLSLHLSVRDHRDERVAMAAEQLLEQMPWW